MDLFHELTKRRVESLLALESPAHCSMRSLRVLFNAPANQFACRRLYARARTAVHFLPLSAARGGHLFADAQSNYAGPRTAHVATLQDRISPLFTCSRNNNLVRLTGKIITVHIEGTKGCCR